MPLRNTLTTYGTVAIGFHWLVFFLLIGSFSLGFYMHDLPVSPTKVKLYNYHKWLGVTIFMLVVLRLAWRLWSPPPPLPASMPAWEKRAANLSHRLIYLLLFAIPLSGWLMSSAKGFQTVWLGWLPIPDLLEKNPPLGETLEELHEALNFTLLALVTVHVLAALKHHYRDRDTVLARMMPGMTPSSRGTPQTGPADEN